MIFSIVIVGILVIYLYFVVKKTGNIVIKSDFVHYKTDLLTNLWVILSLIVVKITKIYYVDFLIWFLIWGYIIKEAFSLFREWIWILLDEALEERDKIVNILNEFVKEWKINSWHDLKTRKWWHYKFVEFHFVVDPNMTVKQAHDLWEEIAKSIEKIDPNGRWEIIYHVDRENDSTCEVCSY